VPDYAARLESLAEHGVNTRPWWARAGEAALRGGNVSDAERWLAKFLEEAAADSPAAAAAGIRLADLLAARGEVEEARERLDAIAALHEAAAVGLLARIRISALDLASGDATVAMEQLRLAGAASHPGIAAYANAVLGRAALERGRIDEAFSALGRASRLGAANPLPHQISEDLRRSLDAAIAESEDGKAGGCPQLVLRLAVRRAHLMEISQRPEPFVRLGACYEEIGLYETAAELYRSIPRRFGPAAVTQVALPLARATLAMGQFADTRTHALANAAHSESDPQWLLLLAEASLEAQEPKPALAVLAPRVAAGGAVASEPRALALLAQAALEVEPSPETTQLLDDTLVKALAGAEGQAADSLAESGLLAATLRRRAGELGRARVLYRLAVERLPPGWRRAEASYWLVRLGDEFEAPEIAPQEAGPGAAALVRLTDHARMVRRLQRRYGIPPADATEGGAE